MTPLSQKAVEDARRQLASCALFRGLVTGERDALVGRARMRQFGAGEPIFLMGSAGTSMMAVLSGRVRISIPSQEGREVVLAVLQPGEVFGEIALLDGKERTADAHAVTDCNLAVLERRDVLEFLEHHPNAWIRLVEVLCDRLRATDRQMAEVAMQHLPARLARALLRMTYVETLSRPTDRVQVSQRELGNIVGATRESVNNCLGQWQRAGWVRIDRTSIAIWDRASKKVPRAPKPKGSRRLRIKLSAEERKMLAAITVALNGKER
jgi:CRP/FNR family transcriptional regulator, cyclic AMP receptor protein